MSSYSRVTKVSSKNYMRGDRGLGFGLDNSAHHLIAIRSTSKLVYCHHILCWYHLIARGRSDIC